ncbi:MAG: hypothetical protein Q9210_001054 [Variospora velana]
MVTPGGETAFASRLIAESAALGNRVQWYTTLLGKYSSVAVVVEELRGKYGVGNWAVREFVQGESKTRRWGVGWSWGARRPAEEVARAVGPGVPRALLPFPGRFAFEVTGAGVQGVADRVNVVLEGMDLEWRYRPQVSAGVGFARENVWSRAARRQRLKYKDGAGGGDGNEKMEEGEKEEEEEEEPALGFKVQLLMLKEGKGTEVVVRWLLGKESVLFESFCGMLKRQVVGG